MNTDNKQLAARQEISTNEAPDVYRAINRVQADLSRRGIGKEQRNVQQNYAFRGIDDVYNVLGPILATNGLVILPRVLNRTCEARTSIKGTIYYAVVLEVDYHLVSSHDGSKEVIHVVGEAMDSADKATNKAMSAAYKTAAFQAFCIPLEGDDADQTTPEPITGKHNPRMTKIEAPQRSASDPAVAEKPLKPNPDQNHESLQKKLSVLMEESGLQQLWVERFLYDKGIMSVDADLKKITTTQLSRLVKHWNQVVEWKKQFDGSVVNDGKAQQTITW